MTIITAFVCFIFQQCITIITKVQSTLITMIDFSILMWLITYITGSALFMFR